MQRVLVVKFWTKYWFYWLLSVFGSWLAAEVTSIVMAHAKGEKSILTWTLSDTIRRWSASHRWIAPITVGTMAMLVWHFFAQINP